MKEFSLPDLTNKSEVFCSYFFNKKKYNFKFQWCDTFCLIDIYVMNEGRNVYILQGYPIIPELNLIERIKNPNLITGKLFITNKLNNGNEITETNFSTDFKLIYYEEN